MRSSAPMQPKLDKIAGEEPVPSSSPKVATAAFRIRIMIIVDNV